MNKVYLLIGGNLGNKIANLELAKQLLETKAGHLRKTSDIYETSAWGIEDQPPFLNQAVLLETALPPKDLLKTLLDIENTMGRKREMKYGPRIIDIDILLYGDIISEDPELTIPHPQLPFRKFALVPLINLEPGLTHPLLGLTMEELSEQCKDKLSVDKKNDI